MGPSKSTRPKSLEELFAGIPRAVLDRIAGQRILERLSAREAYKLRFVIAESRDAGALVAAARIVERLLAQGPRQLARGHATKQDFDEGLRLIRLKLRELAQVLASTGQKWKLRLSDRERVALQLDSAAPDAPAVEPLDETAIRRTPPPPDSAKDAGAAPPVGG